MNKTEYMELLTVRLKRLPKDDYERAIDYFEEYFQDAGMENEAQVIEDLGTPEFAADQIIANIAIKNTKEPVKDVKKGIGAVWVGILALFAAPIALPIVLVFAAAIFLLVLAVLLTIFAFVLSGVLFVILGPLSIAAGFSILSTNVPAFLTCLGMGIASIGIGLLIVYEMMNLCKSFLTGIVNMFGRMIKKGGKKND